MVVHKKYILEIELKIKKFRVRLASHAIYKIHAIA